MLSTGASFLRTGRARLEHVENPTWNANIFAAECAGCHATAIDPETHAFAAPSLDCFTCHGDAPPEHANDPKLMPLAKKRKDSAAVVTSICAMPCAIRQVEVDGPAVPNNFVAGDNLFRDFEVDLALADDATINPADRHVLDNVRDVVLYGRESMTCLSCHNVHTGSTKAHRDVPDQKYCLHCHEAGKSKKEHIPYEVHSKRCQY